MSQCVLLRNDCYLRFSSAFEMGSDNVSCLLFLDAFTRLYKGLVKQLWSNEANMLVQHHPTLLHATCWPHLNTMLDYVGFG